MTRSTTLLRTDDHARDSAGMTYVYPVVSRRAGGVSIGINLNPNNACNWRCVYCQVPDLKRGGPPPIDLDRLRQELDCMIGEALHGAFMQQRVPEEERRLMDVAFSGNGEPTSAREFPAAVAVVLEVLRKHGLEGKLPVRLITNGSLSGRAYVREGISLLGTTDGEVWFKLDAATTDAIARTNNIQMTPATAARRVRACAALCRTWLQTCLFQFDGQLPTEAELDAYVALVAGMKDVIAGVHFYGLARPSLQPEAPRLAKAPADWMDALAGRLKEKGLTVTVSP